MKPIAPIKPARTRPVPPQTAPAGAPVIKSVKTNPAPSPAEKRLRGAAAPRPKIAVPDSAPMKPNAKSAKTNSRPDAALQAALPFDIPPATPAPRAAHPPKPADARAPKPVKTPPTPVAQSKTIAVKSAKTAPAAKAKTVTHTVKVVTETVFEGGALWKMSGKNGVAYVKDAALAGELLATDPKNLPKRAMAVYYDKKGKAFAWQVRFDTDRWEEVMRRLG